MNPNIAHGLMLARIAEMHRQARRIDTGRTARSTLTRTRRCVIGLIATAMAFLIGVPAAQAINVPPPGENSGAAPSVVIHPVAVGGMCFTKTLASAGDICCSAWKVRTIS